MDKLAKVRAEVARIQLYTQSETLKQILSFIDSLEEEPVSESLEKASTKYAQDKYMPVQTSQAFKAGAKWQREKDESTTEDLGEYINELSKQFPEVSFAKLSRIAVRVAKWQEDKDKQILNEEGIIVLPEEEFEKMKRSLIKLSEREQQMMADAIDGEVGYWNLHGLSVNMDLPSTVEEGDKVKVILIKKD